MRLGVDRGRPDDGRVRPPLFFLSLCLSLFNPYGIYGWN